MNLSTYSHKLLCLPAGKPLCCIILSTFCTVSLLFFSIKDRTHAAQHCLMQHSISYSAALVQMAESVPVLSAPVEDITVCRVIRYVRAANGRCGAKDHETSRLMKIWRESSVCSLQYREPDKGAMVRDAPICVCLCV